MFRLYCLKRVYPQYGYNVSSIGSKGEECLILAFLLFMSSTSSLMQAYLLVFQWSLRVSLSWTIKRVWKFVYYRLHVLLCILHNVVHHFIRENVGFFNKDRFFIDLAASPGPGAYFCTDSQLLFYNLFVFICLPFTFYLFLWVSIFKTTLSLWWCIIINITI